MARVRTIVLSISLTGCSTSCHADRLGDGLSPEPSVKSDLLSSAEATPRDASGGNRAADSAAAYASGSAEGDAAGPAMTLGPEEQEALCDQVCELTTALLCTMNDCQSNCMLLMRDYCAVPFVSYERCLLSRPVSEFSCGEPGDDGPTVIGPKMCDGVLALLRSCLWP